MASKNCLNNTADHFLQLDAVMKVFDINIDRMGLVLLWVGISVADTKVD